MSRRASILGVLLALGGSGCIADGSKSPSVFSIEESDESEIFELGPLAAGSEALSVDDELLDSDPVLSQGQHFRAFHFTCSYGCAGRPIHIGLQADYDTLPLVATPSDVLDNDDDEIVAGAGVTPPEGIRNAFVQTVGEFGDYLIYATTYAAGEAGPFSLDVRIAEQVIGPADRWDVVIDRVILQRKFLSVDGSALEGDDLELYFSLAAHDAAQPGSTGARTLGRGQDVDFSFGDRVLTGFSAVALTSWTMELGVHEDDWGDDQSLGSCTFSMPRSALGGTFTAYCGDSYNQVVIRTQRSR